MIQSGLIDDPSLGLNYPSIAVNDLGDVVIGFSGGDPNTFMSTYFVAGQTVDGITTFGSITLSMAGVADYERLDSMDVTDGVTIARQCSTLTIQGVFGHSSYLPATLTNGQSR